VLLNTDFDCLFVGWLFGGLVGCLSGCFVCFLTYLSKSLFHMHT